MGKKQQVNVPVGTAEGTEPNLESGLLHTASTPSSPKLHLKTTPVVGRKGRLSLGPKQSAILVVLILVYATLARRACKQLFRRWLTGGFEYHGALRRRLSDERNEQYLQLLCLARLSGFSGSFDPFKEEAEGSVPPEQKGVKGSSEVEPIMTQQAQGHTFHPHLGATAQYGVLNPPVLGEEDIYPDEALMRYIRYHGLSVDLGTTEGKGSEQEGHAAFREEQKRRTDPMEVDLMKGRFHSADLHSQTWTEPSSSSGHPSPGMELTLREQEKGSGEKQHSPQASKPAIFRLGSKDFAVNALRCEASKNLEDPVRDIAREAGLCSISSCTYSPEAAARVAKALDLDPVKAYQTSERARNALTLVAEAHCLYRLPRVARGAVFQPLNLCSDDVSSRANKTQTARIYAAVQSVFSKEELTQTDLTELRVALVDLVERFPIPVAEAAKGRMQAACRTLARSVMIMDFLYSVNTLFPGAVPKPLWEAIKQRTPLNVGPFHPQALKFGAVDVVSLFCVVVHSFVRGERPNPVILVHAKQIILSQKLNVRYNWVRFRSFLSDSDIQVLETLGISSRLT